MKRFIFIFLTLLTFNICESYAQKYHTEMWTYFPKEPLFRMENPKMVQDIISEFKTNINDGGFPSIALYKKHRLRVIIFWIYIGDFQLSDYYNQDFDNPFPELIPISANYKIKFWWNKNHSQFIKDIGITYLQRDSSNATMPIDSLIKIDTLLLKKSIQPYKKLRKLEKIY